MSNIKFKNSEQTLIEHDLRMVYEEVMWLATRPRVTASGARSWYTHTMAIGLSKRIRRFTGNVSEEALKKGETLRLEHYKRIQAKLTKLVERHKKNGKNPEEFIKTVLDCEQVHIVTLRQNYDARIANGDYKKAGIKLVQWKDIPPDIQEYLWKKMLKGKVSNADRYRPKTL